MQSPSSRRWPVAPAPPSADTTGRSCRIPARWSPDRAPAVRVPPFGHIPHRIQAALGHAVLQTQTAWLRQWREVLGGARHRRSRRDAAERLPCLGDRRVGVHITRDHQYRIGRTVVGLEPRLHVLHLGLIQIFHGADGGPGIRVTGGIGVSSQSAPTPCRRARFHAGVFHFSPPRAAHRACPDRWRPTDGPCGRTPSIAQDQAPVWGRSGNSWCDRGWWCRSSRLPQPARRGGNNRR